jgi:hypothetical protein
MRFHFWVPGDLRPARTLCAIAAPRTPRPTIDGAAGGDKWPPSLDFSPVSAQKDVSVADPIQALDTV